jgi:hypothetical protein
MPRVLGVVAVALIVAACPVGTPAGRFEPARGPGGVAADLRLVERGRVRGELLALTDSALVIRDSAIAVVRYASIREGTFRQVGAVSFNRRAPRDGDRDRLRRVSRFPQGLSPELLQRLLEAHGQSEPVVY